jgi:hypothetical protein
VTGRADDRSAPLVTARSQFIVAARQAIEPGRRGRPLHEETSNSNPVSVCFVEEFIKGRVIRPCSGSWDKSGSPRLPQLLHLEVSSARL